MRHTLARKLSEKIVVRHLHAAAIKHRLRKTRDTRTKRVLSAKLRRTNAKLKSEMMARNALFYKNEYEAEQAVEVSYIVRECVSPCVGH